MGRLRPLSWSGKHHPLPRSRTHPPPSSVVRLRSRECVQVGARWQRRVGRGHQRGFRVRAPAGSEHPRRARSFPSRPMTPRGPQKRTQMKMPSNESDGYDRRCRVGDGRLVVTLRSGRGAGRAARAHFPRFQAHRVGNRRGCPDRVETTGKPPELRRWAPPPQGRPDQHASSFTQEPAGPCAEAGRALVSSGAPAPEGDGQYATTWATSSPRRGGSAGAGSPRSGLWYVGHTDP